MLFGKAPTFYLKPMLMIPLIIATSLSTSELKNLLICALAFCWIGDVLLLFSTRNSMYFILGLVSFMAGHFFYIKLFARMIKNEGHQIKFYPIILSVVVLYLGGFYFWMSPYLGSMLVPVMVYAIVISAMLYLAMLTYRKLDNPATIYLIIGAFSFVFSDTILAVNKFYTPLPLSSVWVMSTYILAPGSIVWGCLNLFRIMNSEMAVQKD